MTDGVISLQWKESTKWLHDKVINGLSNSVSWLIDAFLMNWLIDRLIDRLRDRWTDYTDTWKNQLIDWLNDNLSDWSHHNQNRLAEVLSLFAFGYEANELNYRLITSCLHAGPCTSFVSTAPRWSRVPSGCQKQSQKDPKWHLRTYNK